MGIYFDNAATSWPKPKSVIRAMKKYFTRCGGNPGRSGHEKAIEAGRIVLQAREAVADLFSVTDPSKVIITKNATEAVNIVLFGMLREGDHFVTTSMEHNAVLRPALVLSQQRIDVSIVEGDENGFIRSEAVGEAINSNTKLVCINHASNVTGTIQDIEAIARNCRERGVPVLIDAAQTAGAVDIDCAELGIDFLAASGHKGLLGPQGTGFLYCRDEVPVPLMYGGTGSLSDSEEQPEFYPDRFESGTLNVIGAAGLAAGIEYIYKRGVNSIREHELEMLTFFLNGLKTIPGVTVYGPELPTKRTGVVSIRIDQFDTSEVGEILNDAYGIYTRIGLHCAPRAHKTIGTFPDGTVRFGIGPFTKRAHIRKALKAIREIAISGRERSK